MYIVAEIGFNHEGDMDTAVNMIKAAAESGVDAVKFQTYRAIDLALPSSPHYNAIQCGEMNFEQHKKLYNMARDYGVDFLSTPYSPWAVELLEKIGVPAYKVASMDCTNTHLLKYIAQTGKPIYLSTGMATLAEIAEILEYLKQKKSGSITLLHCISLYPTTAETLNLALIPFLKQLFNLPVGYSDHYPGIQGCLVAAMIGAEVIETHFTLDASKEGGDHYHSVEPESLKQLIADIELSIKMWGDKDAIFSRPDRSGVQDFRRGLYAGRDLHKGDILREVDVLLCRPTSELSPADIDELVGQVLQQDISSYQALQKNFIGNKRI